MKHIKLIDRTFNNDIRFKGVFSYRHLCIIAWTLLVLAQVLTLLVIAKRFHPQININEEYAETFFLTAVFFIEWILDCLVFVGIF
ncbi:MAG: hypothetical protein IJK72_02825 [Mycoplasma sp.]|nr:hypothetical protein [Mycoplasma sp.]